MTTDPYKVIRQLVADGWEIAQVTTPTGEVKIKLGNRLPWSVVFKASADEPVAILGFAAYLKAEEACRQLVGQGFDCEVMISAKALRTYPNHFVL